MKKGKKSPPIPAGIVHRFSKLELPSDFHSIDELVDRMDAGGVFDDETVQEVVRAWKKVQARRLIKTVTDDDGWNLFHSIIVKDEDGETRRVYGNELYYDVAAYKQVISYHAEQAAKHIATANEMTRRARNRLGLSARQLPMPRLEEKP